jgi:carnitine O-acetyltransferase
MSHQPSRRHHHDHPKLQFPHLPAEWRDKYTRGQMFKYDDKLMRLPVPPLEQTLQKYIASVEPLLTEEELAETRRQVEVFGRPGGVGETLQKKLQERAASRESWLAEWWLQVAYLGWRLPVPVHVSPATVFPRRPIHDRESFLREATSHSLAIIKWVFIVQNEAVPPDVYRGKPMCMSQFDMFQKCRIPRADVDESHQTPITESRHILVVRNGHFFKVNVLYDAPNGELSVAPASHIMDQLETVMSDSEDHAPFPVGILTSEHRDTWAKMRERLASDPVNTSSLRDIETAMFTLCLDKPHPQIPPPSPSPIRDSHAEILAKRFLHGNGTHENSCNRWFDSAVQIVVGEDGGSGSLLEHSAGDGPAAIASNIFAMDLATMNYDVFADKSPVEPSALQPAKRLRWNISPDTAADIQTAGRNMNKLVEDTDIACFTFSDFGKDFCKVVKLSPDSFIQMAVQLAFYKLYGYPTAAYESAGTRWFKYGRTDTIRSTTNAAHAFVKAMTNPDTQAEEKANLLVNAVIAHSNYTQEAISGQAIDRHLLGLKLIASENGIETPALYTDVAYSRSQHFRLSTSQVPVANHRMFLCFGAVVDDGYGVCYNPREHEILFTVSSWHHCSDTDSLTMSSQLVESLKEMRELLVGTGRARSHAKL